MKVVIPLAGKGTRLRPHTYVTPKPLLRVAGRPVMSYILDELRGLDVSELIVITGHLKETIEAYLAAEYADLKPRFVEQRVQDGTAGAVRLAEPYVDEDVLIIFVDTLFDADLSLTRTLPPDEAGVIWVKEVEDYRRFGVVLTDADGFMTRIIEKPTEPVSRLANIGLYYVRDHALLFRGIARALQSEPGPGGEFYLTDALQYMIDQGARIRTVPVEGWYDCGKPETLLATNRHLLETGRARRPEDTPGVRIHDPVRVEPGVELEDVELGPNVTVGRGTRIRSAQIRDAIIGEDAVLEDVRLHDSLLGDRVHVAGTTGHMSLGPDAEVAGE